MKLKRIIWIEAILAVCAVAVFPAIFLYCQNADEAGFTEVLPVLLAYIAVGLILMLIIGGLVRSVTKAALVSMVFLLLLLNFSILESLLKLVFPSIRYWHTVPIILVIGFHIAYFICHIRKDDLVGGGSPNTWSGLWRSYRHKCNTCGTTDYKSCANAESFAEVGQVK